MLQLISNRRRCGRAAKDINVPPDSRVVREQAADVMYCRYVGQFLLPSPRRVQWEYIAAVIAACAGNVSEAARRLGMSRRSVQRIIYGKDVPAR
jgi:transcriptional regulator of acetoin/glycerol metabolism